MASLLNRAWLNRARRDAACDGIGSARRHRGLGWPGLSVPRSGGSPIPSSHDTGAYAIAPDDSGLNGQWCEGGLWSSPCPISVAAVELSFDLAPVLILVLSESVQPSGRAGNALPSSNPTFHPRLAQFWRIHPCGKRAITRPGIAGPVTIQPCDSRSRRSVFEG